MSSSPQDTALSSGIDLSGKSRRLLQTPEGVPLSVDLADRAERFAAVFIDWLILHLGILISWLILQYGIWETLGWSGANEVAQAILIVVYFVVRSFYFTYFELRWNGQTPGKKALKIRVVDRMGRPLKGDSIIVRNLMRELEMYLPLQALAMGADDFLGAIATLLLVVWAFVLSFLPLFNRNRLRLGDMAAGTWVVKTSRARLAKDLADRDEQKAVYQFTERQLKAYGIFELQTLEDVLRAGNPQVMEQVAEAIAKRIEWEGTKPDQPQQFLEDYYAALRRQLEAGVLFGKRRKDKHDTGQPKPEEPLTAVDKTPPKPWSGR